MRNGLRFGEVLIAGDAQNGVIFDRYDNECEARLDGEVIRAHPLATVCCRALSLQGVHLGAWSFIDDRPAGFAASPQRTVEAAPAALPAAPTKAPQNGSKQQETANTRCRHYKAIKACFAVFIERGLSTDDEAMRATLGRLLGREVPSRKTLSATDWEAAARAAKWLPV